MQWEATILILIFVLAGTFAATVAAIGTLIMGHPWWMGLASYIAAGMLTVCFAAVFFAFARNPFPRKAEPQNLRAHLPMAEH